MEKWLCFGRWWGSLILASLALGLVLLYFLLAVKMKTRANAYGDSVVPRGSLGWPLIGETLEFIASGCSSDPVSFMVKRKSLYGEVFRTSILGKNIVVSTDPDVNRLILQNHGNVFTPCYPKSITELLGKSSILQTNGPLHKRMHALVGVHLKSPTFKDGITKAIDASVQSSLSSWPSHVCLEDEARKITFEILVKVLLSIDPGREMDALKRDFEEYIKGLICLPINLPGTRLHKSLKAKKGLLRAVNRIVESRKKGQTTTSDEEGRSEDLLDVLLRDGDREMESVSGNIIEMMIPGEETMPTAITLAVKFLTDNPLALACLLEENMELKRRKDDSKEEYSWTDYLSLRFTQNVISETLRLGNIINAVWRKSLKDVEFKGYFIPQGWCVLASFSSVHMDDENYENPYEFNPWRWKDSGACISSNTFTPFGGGQRLCPGMELSRLEIAIFLHRLITKFRWVAEEDEIIYFPTVRMKSKLPITVIPLSVN